MNMEINDELMIVSLKRSDRCVRDFDGFADALLMAEYARRHMA